MLQALDDLLIHGSALQGDTYVCTSAIAKTLRVDIKAAAYDDLALDEVLHTLVDGSTGDVTLGSHVLKRNTRILGQNTQNLLVKIIYLFHLI
jgi:hypothetical protein